MQPPTPGRKYFEEFRDSASVTLLVLIERGKCKTFTPAIWTFTPQSEFEVKSPFAALGKIYKIPVLNKSNLGVFIWGK